MEEDCGVTYTPQLISQLLRDMPDERLDSIHPHAFQVTGVEELAGALEEIPKICGHFSDASVAAYNALAKFRAGGEG